MAKFRINNGFGDAEDVEAQDFRQIGDYWHFFDEEGELKFVIVASKVRTINREAS